MSENKAAPATPAAAWREKGEPDPHGKQYDCERAQLTLGKLTDDELANEAFMNYDRFPPLDEVIAGRAKMPIVYMTAVKDRIRWLSRALVKAQTEAQATRKQVVREAVAIINAAREEGETDLRAVRARIQGLVED